jgi:cardiolipin synthase (CMP-forming)
MTAPYWGPKLTLANRITITRFLFVPVFILLTVYYMESVNRNVPNEILRWAATMVFIVSCLTDALDGYVARSRHERTRLGTLLDPLADKALLLSGLILLTGPWGRLFQPHLPIWYVLLVISRDVLLIAGAVVIHLAVAHIEVRPRVSGKLATVFQMLLILWVLIGGAVHWFPRLLWLAAACTLVSSVQYIVDGIRQLEKAHPHDKPPSPA